MYRHYLLLISFLLPLLSVSWVYAAVSGSSEVACSTYGSDALSCNQCFDGGTDYVGDTTAKAFDDTFINNSTNDDFLIRRSNGLSAGPVVLQSQVSVGVSSDYGVSFPASIPWLPFGGDDAFVFLASTSTQIARMNGGVLFTAVSTGADASKPALRFDYIVKVQQYDFVTASTQGPEINHKECAFVKPRWCGDGIVSNGEVCDEGAQNGQPGHCNTSCNGPVAVAPSCDSMTATPLSGTAPLDVSLTCNATNATSYLIDCGNGTTNLATTAICRYREGGTFTPRCTINGSISSPACTKTITVTAPPPAPACSTVITGTQTFPISSVTPGLCNLWTSTGFTVNIVWPQSNYSWFCTNGVTNSPACTANYTPPVVTSPDLALKKYVNGSDAQNVATAYDVNNNSAFTYTITLQNVGSGALISSTTTVSDPLPAGITLTAPPSGAGWTCSGSVGSTSFSCTRTEALAIGAFFPTISVPVRVSSMSTYLTNTAELVNINDVLTANNTDPAVIHILPVALPPVCSSTVSGALLAPITAGVCNSGTPINFLSGGTNPINYTWNCTNGTTTTPVCRASYTPVGPPAPSCNSITVSPSSGNIPLRSSVSCNTTSATTVSITCGNGQVINNGTGSCLYATVGTFTPTCTVNGTITNASCQWTVTATNPSVSNFDLRLKKFVNGNDTSITITPTSSGWTPGPVPESPEFAQPLNLASFPGVTLTVGPGKIFSTLSAAILAASSGDKIRVDQWEYVSDYSVIGNKRLAIIGLGSGATLRKSAPIPNGKAILVSSADLYIENMVFTDADVPDANGAWIRYEGGILTVIGSTFRNNENGILSIGYLPPWEGKVWVGSSKFIGNGKNATGFTHGLYIWEINFFLIRDSIVSGTRQWHHVKSRASNTYILNNILDDNGADASYNIDLPNGWNGYVYGNTIIQSITSSNHIMVAYSAEKNPPNPGTLTLENNIFQNTGAGAIGIRNFGTNTVISKNNTFQWVDTKYVGTVIEQTGSWSTGSGSTGSGSSGSTTTPVTYTFIIDNLWPGTATGTTTVTDTFPAGITPVSTSGTGWSCSLVWQTFTCSRSDSLNSGSGYSIITTQALVTNTNGSYRNYACLSNPGDPNEWAVLNPDAGLYKVNNCDPATVIVNGGTFDLSLKKYVWSGATLNDAQDGSPVTLSGGQTFNYTLRAKNEGTLTITGTTTITDTGATPTGVIVRSGTGTGWNCTLSGSTLSCTTTQSPLSGAFFSDVVITATAPTLTGTYRNLAVVSHPLDTNLTNNTDPANIRIGTGWTVPVLPSCTALSGSLASPVSPSTSVTYSCAPPTAFTGVVSIIEYRIQCAPGDPTAVWGTGSTRACLAPATESTSQTITCAVRDRTNSGSIFTGSDIGACRTTMSTTWGGGGWPSTYYIPLCSAGVRSCGTRVYNSLPGCIASEGVTCYTNITECTNANTLSCSGPGGGCSGPGCGGCVWAGCGGWGGSAYCGNGILEPFRGENCDLGNFNGQPGSSCDSNCKLMLTNPGANPILDIWMRIPTLSQYTRFGFSWLDGIDGKIRVSENQVVVGQNGNIFSIYDQLFFGIHTRYQIPLLIPASHNVCIYSDNLDAVKQDAAGPSGEFCKTIGELADGFTRTINDEKYVVVGKGVYIACVDMTATGCVQYGEFTANDSPLPGVNVNEIPLFKGNDLLNASTSLREAFQGNRAGTGGNIRLTIADPSLRKNDRPIDVGLPVRVSSAMVASTTTTTNRVVGALDPFNAEILLNNFLLGLKRSTAIINRTTTTSSTSSVTSRITVNGNTSAANISVSTLDQLIALKTNGNENVLSLSGHTLTIQGCANDTISLSGVRSLIIEGGDLIIKCNLVYADANASWAFIVKNGNIAIYGGDPTRASSFGVTNIVGVFVNIGGSFQPNPLNTTSQKILKIEGSLYGNATPLFDSRLYVRGTSAYEIITAGVSLNYSNRALINPPPLLSSYLGNYNVDRVVR